MTALCACGERCSVCAQGEEIAKEGWDAARAFAYGVVLGNMGAAPLLRHFCEPCKTFMDGVVDRLEASAEDLEAAASSEVH